MSTKLKGVRGDKEEKGKSPFLRVLMYLPSKPNVAFPYLQRAKLSPTLSLELDWILLSLSQYNSLWERFNLVAPCPNSVMFIIMVLSTTTWQQENWWPSTQNVTKAKDLERAPLVAHLRILEVFDPSWCLIHPYMFRQPESGRCMVKGPNYQVSNLCWRYSFHKMFELGYDAIFDRWDWAKDLYCRFYTIEK